MEWPKFMMDPSEAESMAKQSGFSSVIQLLPSLVRSAQALARPPISSYPVAAVGLSSDGRVFFGVNLEFPGLPLHHSVHAEQFLATNLALHRPRHRPPHLRFLAVSSAPCGHCRQFLQEIRGAPDIGIFFGDSELREISSTDFKPLSHYLPQRFGPDDLLDKNMPLLLEPHNNNLVFACSIRSSRPNPCNGVSGSEEDELVPAALAAANESHAPYSGCPSGVALLDCQGKVYRGSYMESAAHNPSMGPLQAALVAYIVGNGGDGGHSGYDKISAAALVEKKGVPVVQEHTARLLLQLVSPRCEFLVVHCTSASNDCKSLPFILE